MAKTAVITGLMATRRSGYLARGAARRTNDDLFGSPFSLVRYLLYKHILISFQNNQGAKHFLSLTEI